MDNVKQPVKEYKIEIAKNNKINLSLLSEWFSKVLNLPNEEYFENEIKEICNYVLILNRKLSQVSLLPIFYKGKINEIKDENEKFIIILELSYIDLIAQEFYYKIIDFSFRYIFWMMQKEPNIENIRHFSNI